MYTSLGSAKFAVIRGFVAGGWKGRDQAGARERVPLAERVLGTPHRPTDRLLLAAGATMRLRDRQGHEAARHLVLIPLALNRLLFLYVQSHCEPSLT